MEFWAVVEIPAGSRNNYEIDPKDGTLFLESVVSEGFPYSYGLIPHTLTDDGDALDIFIISDESLVPLSKIKIRPLGYLKFIDDGENDFKIIAVIEDDNSYSELRDIKDVQQEVKSSIEKFLKNIKTAKGVKVSFNGWCDANEAIKLIKDSKVKNED